MRITQSRLLAQSLFHKTVPSQTFGTLPHPLRDLMPAFLTNKNSSGFSHDEARQWESSIGQTLKKQKYCCATKKAFIIKPIYFLPALFLAGCNCLRVFLRSSFREILTFAFRRKSASAFLISSWFFFKSA